MPSFQVDGNCYTSAQAAASAMAAKSVGLVVAIGGKAYVVDASATADASITYVFTDTSGGPGFTSVAPVTPQLCGLLDTSDGLLIGWAIALAWIATAGVLFLRRGVNT